MHEEPLERLRFDGVGVGTEHIILELLNNSIEDNLMVKHLLLVFLKVESRLNQLLSVLSPGSQHLFGSPSSLLSLDHSLLHLVEDGGHVHHEDKRLEYVFILGKNSRPHLRLHRSVEHLGVVSVTAPTVQDTDEEERSDVEPIELGVQTGARVLLRQCLIFELVQEPSNGSFLLDGH